MGNSACFAGVHGPVPETPKRGFKVCICGAAGGIGQPLSLLMAMDPLVAELSVFDLVIAMVPAEGIGSDLDHIDRRCRVKGYSLGTQDSPIEHLEECLTGCHLVIMPAGVPSKQKSNSELLKINGNITKNIMEACGKFCPEAIVGLIVNPLNSVLPAMSRLYEKAGLDPMKVCGITTVDSVRANKFVHEETGARIESINVPVVGGYSCSASSGVSALPLFSQDRSASQIPADRRRELVERLQIAGEEVMAAKKGKGGVVLTQAHAAARFGKAVLAGLSGRRTVETVLVKSSVCPDLQYFSSRVTFGPNGIEKTHPLGDLSAEEKKHLREVVQVVGQEIKDGLEYAESIELTFGQSGLQANGEATKPGVSS